MIKDINALSSTIVVVKQLNFYHTYVAYRPSDKCINKAARILRNKRTDKRI